MRICLSRCHQHMTNSVRRRFTSLTSLDMSLCLASAEQKRTDVPRTRSQTVSRLASGARLLCNSSQPLACDVASRLKLHYGRQFGRFTHLREGPPLRRGRQGWSRVGEIWVKPAGIRSKRPLAIPCDGMLPTVAYPPPNTWLPAVGQNPGMYVCLFNVLGTN